MFQWLLKRPFSLSLSYPITQSEDEALARAMAASVQDANKAPRPQQQQPSRTSPQESEDEQLARAIAASLEETSAQSASRNQQGNNSSNCNVCWGNAGTISGIHLGFKVYVVCLS